jgi:hypothetical protein
MPVCVMPGNLMRAAFDKRDSIYERDKKAEEILKSRGENPSLSPIPLASMTLS